MKLIQNKETGEVANGDAMVAIVTASISVLACVFLMVKNRQKEEKIIFLEYEIEKLKGGETPLHQIKGDTFKLTKENPPDKEERIQQPPPALKKPSSPLPKKPDLPPLKKPDDFRQNPELLSKLIATMTDVQKKEFSGKDVSWSVRLCNLKVNGFLQAEYSFKKNENAIEEQCSVFTTLSEEELNKIKNLPVDSTISVKGIIDTVTSPTMVHLKNTKIV